MGLTFFSGSSSGQYWCGDVTCDDISPGSSAIFHFAVIKALRQTFLPISPSPKRISYSTTHEVVGAVFVNEGNNVEHPSTEVMSAAVAKVKERGLAGLSLFSINEENRVFRGEFARMVAELLYL